MRARPAREQLRTAGVVLAGLLCLAAIRDPLQVPISTTSSTLAVADRIGDEGLSTIAAATAATTAGFLVAALVRSALAESFVRPRANQLLVDLTAGEGPALRDLAAANSIREEHLRTFGELLRAHREELIPLLAPSTGGLRAVRFLNRVAELARGDRLLRRDLDRGRDWVVSLPDDPAPAARQPQAPAATAGPPAPDAACARLFVDGELVETARASEPPGAACLLESASGPQRVPSGALFRVEDVSDGRARVRGFEGSGRIECRCLER